MALAGEQTGWGPQALMPPFPFQQYVLLHSMVAAHNVVQVTVCRGPFAELARGLRALVHGGGASVAVRKGP